MIYRLHVCNEPFSPEHTAFASLEAFHELNPAVSEHGNVFDIYNEVCERWPDAVFMPAVVRMGAGHPVLLGVLPSLDAARDPNAAIPFAAFVRADAQTIADRKEIKNNNGNPFDRRIWKTPVKQPPSGAMIVKSELRASDTETPTRGEATLWRADDKIYLHMEVGGGEISIELAVHDITPLRNPHGD